MGGISLTVTVEPHPVAVRFRRHARLGEEAEVLQPLEVGVEGGEDEALTRARLQLAGDDVLAGHTVAFDEDPRHGPAFVGREDGGIGLGAGDGRYQETGRRAQQCHPPKAANPRHGDTI